MARDRVRALVTGGSRGIGAGVASQLAERGCDILLTYRTDAISAQRLGQDLTERHGVSVVCRRHELGDAASAKELAGYIADEWGGIDVLIANAGTWAGGRLGTISGDAWWSVVETNLRGTQQVVESSLPLLSRGGSIVLVSSVVGIIGFPGDTAYASSKAALIGFARSAAKELADAGVRVNVLAPGFVETDMTDAVSGRARETILNRTLLGRMGTVEELSSAISYLALDATFCTGAVLVMDGGWSL